MPFASRQSVTTLFFGTFVPWYCIEAPMAIIKGYGRYAWAFWEIFSFPFLLRTLLKPWKNLTDAYPARGLNLGAIFQTLTLNCMSRAIGCLFRIAMMGIGIVVHITCLMLFIIFLMLWIAFPVLLILGIGFLLHSFPS